MIWPKVYIYPYNNTGEIVYSYDHDFHCFDVFAKFEKEVKEKKYHYLFSCSRQELEEWFVIPHKRVELKDKMWDIVDIPSPNIVEWENEPLYYVTPDADGYFD